MSNETEKNLRRGAHMLISATDAYIAFLSRLSESYSKDSADIKISDTLKTKIDEAKTIIYTA